MCTPTTIPTVSSSSERSKKKNETIKIKERKNIKQTDNLIESFSCRIFNNKFVVASLPLLFPLAEVYFSTYLDDFDKFKSNTI